jgi:excisionase family DNA binding protein
MELSVSIVEAARRAGVGRSTIYEAIGRGELRLKKSGRRSLILTEDLAAWLKALPDASLTKTAV